MMHQAPAVQCAGGPCLITFFSPVISSSAPARRRRRLAAVASSLISDHPVGTGDMGEQLQFRQTPKVTSPSIPLCPSLGSKNSSRFGWISLWVFLPNRGQFDQSLRKSNQSVFVSRVNLSSPNLFLWSTN